MKAHVLVVADGRSPTALSWIGHLQALDYEVSLASTFPCDPPDGIHSFRVLPVAFSRFSRSGTAFPEAGQPEPTLSGIKKWVRRLAPFLQRLRYFLGPVTLWWYRPRFRAFVRDIQPNLVHALRIPYEGMLGAATPRNIPFLVATWGNDLSLHAQGSLWMRMETRRCLKRADGLTSDTQRDTRLAREWGLAESKPTLVVPGSGGLDRSTILETASFDPDAYGIPKDCPWVVNPRGLRPGSVHQDIFFAAIPKVLVHRPDTLFLCPSMGGIMQATTWVQEYQIESQTFLLPRLSQTELWGLYRQAEVFVSPSSHDGTPNTFLEAIACGCFPVVGWIESLSEWIDSGVNGLLIDPEDPDALADAILQALDSPKLQKTAAERNGEIIAARADQHSTRPLIDAFYQRFLQK
ncbi:MAG: glycosyltransferase family 4 protein [Anaerolineaceae bacterium]|nr:glycosyltransferase family 4 protein [Anaerolineaceae bacterium]